MRQEQQAKQILDAIRQRRIRGGLVVHLGCRDGKLTVALRANDGYLVHGLDRDPKNIERARKYIRSRGLYGKVSVELWKGEHLPYTDNLVNLVVSEQHSKVSSDEILRILVPNGVAYVKKDGTWTKIVKPWPKEIDEWTHFLHDTDNNAVAQDYVVGPPYHVQWIGGPRWARGHESLASVSAVVSASGRIFAIVDEGPIASVTLPARWHLVARDAFNGVVLWKQPIESWEGQLRGFRSGPAELPRRLVATGDRVYVTLGYGKPVTALDAATGEVVRTYDRTDGTLEIVCCDGVLYLVQGDVNTEQAADAARRHAASPPPRNKRILAINAKTGQLLWKKFNADTAEIMPTTLAVSKGRLFFHSTHDVICLDAKSAKQYWRTACPIGVRRLGWSVPTLVVHDDVVLVADRNAAEPDRQDSALSKNVEWIVSIKGGGAAGQLTAYSVATGERLWSCRCSQGYNAPVDVFVIDRLVWTGSIIRSRDPGFTEARDLKTGKVVVRRPRDQEFFRVGMSHHRCYRNKATPRYLVLGRAGVEFIDVKSGRGIENHWVRGTCQYGVIPCNGLLYVPPHTCACYLEAKLNSFNALAPKRTGSTTQVKPRLERGPAYGNVKGDIASTASNQYDWPTYRHDAMRSGSTRSVIPLALKALWQTKLGGRLSSPVVADNRLFVAAVDAHTVHALDVRDGTLLWSYTAGGRVDSPPTIYRGLVLFGSADGWVYCLGASDGKLVWRFRAAPEERRVIAYGQLESAWPIHGSILVENDVAYFAAGRSSYLDGGIYVYRLDPLTGKKLSQTRVDSRDPKTSEQPDNAVQGFGMAGSLPDILSSDGQYIYMRHTKFDRDGIQQQDTGLHLFCPTGFLDDSWWHRSYQMYGTHYISGWGGWWRMGNRVPAGRLLVFDDSFIYGFGRNFYPSGNAGQWNKKEYYHLFAASKNVRHIENPALAKTRGRRDVNKSLVKHLWSERLPLTVHAMVLACKTIFVAGPIGDTNFSQDAFEGKKGVVLWAISTADGRKLAEYELEALPVFDGMIAAAECLYLSTKDGQALCLAGK